MVSPQLLVVVIAPFAGITEFKATSMARPGGYRE
jgi:hypothetical protein